MEKGRETEKGMEKGEVKGKVTQKEIERGGRRRGDLSKVWRVER